MTSCTSESQHPPISNSLPPPPDDLVVPIQWPTDGHVTLPWVHNLMSVFDFSSRHLPPSHFSSVLPVAAFDSLLLAASKLLHKEPNCISVADVTSHVVVVGDVHGQLHDVLRLLKQTGYPADNRVYVFNGDYVDRGAWGLETFLILLAWKVLMLKKVYMLRGNHESKYCTSVYGFENEVLVKYRDYSDQDGGDRDRVGKHVYRKCLGCFEGLPLASVINGSVYTAHGGLFRSIDVGPVRGKGRKGKKKKSRNVEKEKGGLVLGSLEELGRARRSVLDPPWEGANLIPGDVLWSDPSMKPGLAPNKVRGIGLIWGPDCTEEFLKKFQLKLIIRSHEGPDAREKRPGLGGMDQGYTIDHDMESGKLITLFSAPDYPQFQGTKERYRNKGAYIVLEPPNYDHPVFHSFEAVTPRPQVKPYYDYVDAIDSDEELDMASMATDP